MKFITTLLFAISLTLTLSSNAQIEKKDVLIGGSFGFSTNNSGQYQTTNNSNANINPRIGYAIGNNSVLFANLGFSTFREKNEISGSNTQSNGFNAGLAWKRFIPVTEKFGAYGNLNGSFSRLYSRYEYGGTTPNVLKQTSTGFSAGLVPGIYYQAMHWLFLSVDAGGLYYNRYESKSSGNPVSHSSGFSVNFLNVYTFGVDFILHKKKK